jgi:hypothetical protein
LKYNPAQFYYPTTALSAKEVEGKYDTKFRNPKEIFFASLNVAKNFFFLGGGWRTVSLFCFLFNFLFIGDRRKF